MKQTEAVRRCAMDALLTVDLGAVRHLRRVTLTGGMVGKDFDKCFYGTLARGSGTCFEGSHEEKFKTLDEFWRPKGIKLTMRGMNPVENFVSHVLETDTARRSDTLYAINRMCKEILRLHRVVAPPTKMYSFDGCENAALAARRAIPA